MLLCLALLLARTRLATAQGAEAKTVAGNPLPAYDVSTVRPSSGPGGFGNVTRTPTAISFTGYELKGLVMMAYNLRENFIYGPPNWSSRHYDLKAKCTDCSDAQMIALSREQRDQMLQTLLAQRFGLQAHTEERSLPAYQLVVVDGGQKLRSFATEDLSRMSTATSGRGRFELRNATLESLARQLSGPLERPVFDETQTAGHFDLALHWSDDATHAAVPGSELDGFPSLKTALEEQFGLRLVACKRAVKVLVIDHYAEPTPN